MINLTNKIEASKARLEEAFTKHKKAVLWFSGGKDSLVVHHLCQDYMDRITVAWVNTGAALPHMEEFIRKFDVMEIRGNQPENISMFGYPTDIAPSSKSCYQAACDSTFQGPMLQDWRICCQLNRWLPGAEFVARHGFTLSIHGQRKEDPMTANILDKQVEPGLGIEVYAPIHPWTTKEVLEYIKIHNIELPMQYKECNSSFDCWSCTAIDDPAWFEARYQFLKKHYPDKAEELRRRLAIIAVAVDSEIKRLSPTVEKILSD